MRSPYLSRKYTALSHEPPPPLMPEPARASRPGSASVPVPVSKSSMLWMSLALVLAWGVGMLDRGYWTPDEPREADIAWRMSWQTDKAVPLLAGEAFCEKPPLTYWLAALPIRLFGTEAWAARLPNLFYALLTALAVGLLAARCAGHLAGIAAAGAISTFLLSYQVAIWLATDAPLLAAGSVALLGAYMGFYASARRERLHGYLLMHAALGIGFLCKSAAVWVVPVLALLTLAVWERRWRELLRWELYAGLPLQAAMILAWIWSVYVGADGPGHLKVFFWNNLVGRFTRVDAPTELQYAMAHRNSPGKYLIELPLYLFPWTLLIAAALRRAWTGRASAPDAYRPVRFALAASLPSVAVLSLAATARNIYLAPALPGFALLLGWWAREAARSPDRWDLRALRATAGTLLLAVAVCLAALVMLAGDVSTPAMSPLHVIGISAGGLILAVWLLLRAWSALPARPALTLYGLVLAYCALLVGPAAQVYGHVDAWQDLAQVARAIQSDSAGKPLILLAPDETTRAIIDMYARTSVNLISGPLDAGALDRLHARIEAAPQSRIVVRLPQDPPSAARILAPPKDTAPRQDTDDATALPWLGAARLRILKRYVLPHGRSYALLEAAPRP